MEDPQGWDCAHCGEVAYIAVAVPVKAQHDGYETHHVHPECWQRFKGFDFRLPRRTA